MCEEEIENIKIKKEDLVPKFQRMPEKIVEIDYDHDLNILIENYHQKIVVADFWANWCIPCKAYAQIFKKAFKEYSDDFVFIKVNVDKTPNIAQYYGITSIPTTALIKKGEILRKFVGVVNDEVLKQILERFRQ